MKSALALSLALVAVLSGCAAASRPGATEAEPEPPAESELEYEVRFPVSWYQPTARTRYQLRLLAIDLCPGPFRLGVPTLNQRYFPSRIVREAVATIRCFSE